MNGDYIEDKLDNFPELKITLGDEELLRLTKKWKADGKEPESKVKDNWQPNINLWLGKGKNTQRENRVFTGFETFLPILTRQNPEATVERQDRFVDETQMTSVVTKELGYITDTQRLKLKIKQTARNWGFYHLGIMKLEWNNETKEINIKPKVPKKMYFDKYGYIDDGIFIGRYLGEECSMTASEFVKLYPKSKAQVEADVKGNLDSKIKYIEWWTQEYLIVEYNDTFPYRVKNPHYNYAKKEESFDEFGEEVELDIEAKNHFVRPMYPYAFLHVYESEPSIYDETGLLLQARENQHTLNDRVEQVDKNVKAMNNSTISYGLDEQKAVSAQKALDSGGLVSFSDRQTEGIERVPPPGLPSDVYNEMQIQRDAIDQIFSTNAVTRGEDTRDQTVRGKIIARQSDESRIGFISEYVEQMVDYLYNYCVQMMYVYYEREWVAELPETPFLVSVKEGSMIPRDPLTVRNEAIDLFTSGALDLETLYKRLDFEDPRESAIATMIYNVDPMMYLTQILEYQPPQPPMPEAQPMPPTGGMEAIQPPTTPIPGITM